jgi:hypothetical protein
MASIINAATSGGLVTSADTSGILQLQTASTTAVTVDASQNVGIGTSSPSQKLDVSSTSDVAFAFSNSSSVTSGNRGTFYMLNSSNSTVGAIRFGAVTDNVGTEMQFYTRPAAGSLTQTMTLNSVGGLQTLNTISVGNATPSTSGAGITFPATQSASSNANTLDDYEEGTWTPVIVGGTTAGTGTYSSQVGRYTKIGNTVRIHFSVSWTAHTGTGTTIVTGFPFSSNATGQTPFAVFTYGETFTANNVANGGLISNGTTQWEHYQVPVGGGNGSGIPIYNGSAEIQVSGVYQTS